jgi:hypothetical protein
MSGKGQEPMEDQPAPTQKTPKGLEIPVPERREFMDALRKVTRPAKPKR